MDIRRLADADEVAALAAVSVLRTLRAKPDAVLALPTGNTPLPLYRWLAAAARGGLADFSRVRTFNLDEHVGIPPQHPKSFRAFMEQHLLRHLNINPSNTHVPSGVAPDLEAECRRYEELIARVGGIDLCVLSFGVNGHLAYNEPGTPWDTLTHVVELAADTRARLGPEWGGVDRVPKTAITMGMRTLMSAREILVLVTGESKREVFRRFLQGRPDRQLPCSALHQHGRVTVLVDAAAGGE